MSNSVRPHRRQPTRLPHPWDSPGKNTGVGCHFLLQCVNENAMIKLLTGDFQAADWCLSLGCIGAFQSAEWAVVKQLTGTNQAADSCSCTEQTHREYHLSSSSFYRSGNRETEKLSCWGSVNDKVGLRFEAVGLWGQQAFKHPTQCLAHDRLSSINGGQILSRI